MQKAYHDRLSPAGGRISILNRMLDAARWVYNEALATRKRAWEERQEHAGLYAAINLLPRWKAACLDGRHLILSKIGSIKVVLHRPVEGTIKTATVRRTAPGMGD
jgi:hypothetical protein